MADQGRQHTSRNLIYQVTITLPKEQLGNHLEEYKMIRDRLDNIIRVDYRWLSAGYQYGGNRSGGTFATLKLYSKSNAERVCGITKLYALCRTGVKLDTDHYAKEFNALCHLVGLQPPRKLLSCNCESHFERKDLTKVEGGWFHSNELSGFTNSGFHFLSLTMEERCEDTPSMQTPDRSADCPACVIPTTVYISNLSPWIGEKEILRLLREATPDITASELFLTLKTGPSEHTTRFAMVRYTKGLAQAICQRFNGKIFEGRKISVSTTGPHQISKDPDQIDPGIASSSITTEKRPSKNLDPGEPLIVCSSMATQKQPFKAPDRTEPLIVSSSMYKGAY